MKTRKHSSQYIPLSTSHSRRQVGHKLVLLGLLLLAAFCLLLLLQNEPSAHAGDLPLARIQIPTPEPTVPPPPLPPATYYGQLLGSPYFTPTAGMAMTAWISDNLCGETQTQEVTGLVVYVIDVQADGTDTPGCGALGRTVRLKVSSQPMQPQAQWDNNQVHELDLQLEMPVAVDDGYTTAEDTPRTEGAPGVLLNDDDVDGPSLTAVKDTNPTSGTLVLNDNGSFTYTPTLNFNGIVSFTYHATNGTADSNIATVIITVTAVNDAPTFASTPITTAVEDETYTYSIIASDVDVGDDLIITAPTRPAWLNLADNGDGSATLSGIPGRADVGDHHVALQVRDTGGLTDTQSFTITVAAETTPPEVTSTTPTGGAADVARNVPVVVGFSEEMLTSTVTTLITPSLAAIVKTWSSGDTRLTIDHDDFAASTRYTVTVTGNDLAGNPLDPTPTTWTFTTGTELAPEADLALDKVRDGGGVITAGQCITYTFTVTNFGPTSPVTATVIDTFNDATALAGIAGQGCVWPGGTVVTCTITGIVTDTPSALTLVVATSETYSGTLTNNATVAPVGTVIDPSAANNEAGPVHVTVRHEAGDVIPPVITSTSPDDGATDVARNVPVVVSFSEEMLTSTVTTLITPSLAAIVKTWSNGDTRLTISHDDFAASTRYTVTVTGNDLAGNPLDPTPTTWTFTTGTELAPEADLALDKVRDGSGVITAGQCITYTFTVTNFGPTSPVTATVIDTFNDATALAGVAGQGCVWPGGTVVTCTITGIVTDTPSALTLVVTTSETYSGTLTNNATVAPAGTVIDRNKSNDHSGPVAVDVSGQVNTVYLSLVLRNYGG